MQASNVARGGFIAGWEKALSGNGLSCLANMFLLSRKAGVPAVYTYPQAFAELFIRKDVSIIDPLSLFNRNGLSQFLEEHAELFATEPAKCQDLYEGITFEILAIRNDIDKISFSEHHIGLLDWRVNAADDAVKLYCGRGNGLIITGCYWRQYLDMRELAEDGTALRAHLGMLRSEKREGRRQRMAMEADCGHIRIGVHLRLADDYKVWLGGIYHFTVSDTMSVMKRIHEELGDRPHTFYLFSDIMLDPEMFMDIPFHYERGDFFDDFIAIASCNYVVGAPSTFASWASFLGGAKRIVLTRERIADQHTPLILSAIDVPFPTGHYLPGDPTGKTI